MRVDVNSVEFLDTIKQALAQSKDLLVLHRPAYAAGRKHWFLVDNIDDFLKVLATQKYRSSFSLFEGAVLSLRGIATEELKAETFELLIKYEEALFFQKIPGQLELENVGHTCSRSEIEAWFSVNTGINALVGYWPDWDEEIATGYVADADGVIRSGAY